MPMTRPGAEHVEARQRGNEVAQKRRDEQQREVAVDHGRHAGQQLEQRLDRFPHVRRRVLAEIDGERGSGRDRDQKSDARDHERARQQRQNAVLRVGEQRRPLGVGQEVDQRDMAKELHGLADQDVDDRRGHEHREARGSEQDQANQTVEQAAAAQERRARAQRLRCAGAGRLKRPRHAPLPRPAGAARRPSGQALLLPGRRWKGARPFHPRVRIRAQLVLSAWSRSSMATPICEPPPNAVPVCRSSKLRCASSYASVGSGT